MNSKDLLGPELQQFIHQHEADDENKLLLKHKSILGVPAALVVDQIVGRRKTKLKLPTWSATQNILYPPSINLEQCSSEATAAYKVEILKQCLIPGCNKAADLTGGFGVDSFLLSSLFKEVDYVEPDENLFEIVKHNHATLLKARSLTLEARINHHNTTAEKFLESVRYKYDLVYIDPSRRTKGNQKIFLFADCQPDLINLLPRIFGLTDYLLVKASPLIDLLSGINELKCVERIFVVAVDNECKEVLFLCQKDFKDEPRICAINLKGFVPLNNRESFDFSLSDEKKAISSFSDPLTYLYEPNAAILKSGAFKLIGNSFDLQKLQQNTHLYTSGSHVQDFPGRVFKIEALVKPDPKAVRQFLSEGKANVVTRNYPLSPEQLKKKTGLKDGGEKFLIGFSGQTEKYTAICSKENNL